MNRRTLLAGIGGVSIAGTAGCYGLAQLITGDDTDENSDENTSDTKSAENASDSPLADTENGEGNTTSETPTDEEQGEGGENEPEANGTSEGTDRPADAVDTISVVDHGVDISPADDPKVDKKVVCYGTFEVGEYDLRKVRIDAVALAENGDELDQGWVPFFTMEAGEQYSVEIRFFVDPNEIAEYRIGATEAQYAE